MADNQSYGVPFVWEDEEERLFPAPNLPANVQPNRTRLSSESSDSQEGRSSSSQPSLLGLSLKKTPSFINLVERTLSKGKQAAVDVADDDDLVEVKGKQVAVAVAGADVVMNNCPKKQDEKTKASNFPAFFLKIGNWEKVMMYEGDLTVKVYYAKKKLVWEILDGPLKNKIEIQWDNISAIRAHTPENEPGTLEIELEQPPLFFQETDPQPRKHTVWNPAADFTGGQAPLWRRHCVKFSPGVLDKPFENLLMNDSRLLALSRSPFPSHTSPYFDTAMYRVSQLSLLLNNLPPPTSQALLMPVVDTNVGSSSQLQQQIYQPVGVMQQQFQFDQNELLQPPVQQAAVDQEVDQTVNSWLGMNPTTYYDGRNPNFFQNEFEVTPIHSLLPPPPPQLEARGDNFFQHHTDHQLFPQQESLHDFFPDYQLFPSPPQPPPQPQQEALQDFFPQSIMNYQLSPPDQQEAQHEHMSAYQLPPRPQPPSQQESLHEFFPQNYQLQPQQEPHHDILTQHMNFLAPPPPPPPPPQEPQYDFFPHHLNYQLPPPPQQYLGEDDVSIFMRCTNNNSYFTDNINPGSGPNF